MHAAAMKLHPDPNPAATAPAPRVRRRAVATIAVAVVYVLLTAATPWLVRYGADFAPTMAVTAQAATAPAEARCATTPKYGHPCNDNDTLLD